jgi:hypothetical protein
MIFRSPSPIFPPPLFPDGSHVLCLVPTIDYAYIVRRCFDLMWFLIVALPSFSSLLHIFNTAKLFQILSLPAFLAPIPLYYIHIYIYYFLLVTTLLLPFKNNLLPSLSPLRLTLTLHPSSAPRLLLSRMRQSMHQDVAVRVRPYLDTSAVVRLTTASRTLSRQELWIDLGTAACPRHLDVALRAQSALASPLPRITCMQRKRIAVEIRSRNWCAHTCLSSYCQIKKYSIERIGSEAFEWTRRRQRQGVCFRAFRCFSRSEEFKF